MKHTTLLLTIALSALLLASCEKKHAPQAQPPSQADTPAPAEVAQPAASASRFYEDGRVRDTMYIDSPEGLRVRGEPSLSAEKRCSVPHRLPVKVVALGAEATIDGITAPWVEILIPRYEWQGEEAEYGWVFGGFLSPTRAEFSTGNWNKKDYENYLLNFTSWQKEHEDYLLETHVGFFTGKNLSRTSWIDDEEGKWSISSYSGNSFVLRLEYTKNEHYYDENDPEASREVVYKTVEHKIKIIDEAYYFDETLNKNFYGLIDWASETKVSFYLKDSNGKSFYDYVSKIAGTEDAWRANQDIAIKSGVSAKGTEYEQQYHDYWNPIMAEHQRRADTAQPAEEPAPAAYGEKSRPTDALDIVFADGTATAWREGLTLTQAQKEAAVAVIFYRGTECSNDGRERLLGVGLAHQKDGLAWCRRSEANAYRMNIATIQCPARGDEGSLTFEGDLDGSDNLSQIGAYLAAHGSEDDTADAQKYPAFHYAKNYAAQAGSCVAGSPFADGWYLPTIAELFKLWKNRKGVDAASDLCGGDGFDDKYYWSASQYTSEGSSAIDLSFATGGWYDDTKDFDCHSVCAIRDFSGGTPAPAQTAQPPQGEQTARNVLY